VIDDSNLPRNIWRHYLRTLDAFRVLELALREPVVSDQVRPDSPFFGLTQAELPDVLRDMSREVGLESSLALLASFEAILRVDTSLVPDRRWRGLPLMGGFADCGPNLPSGCRSKICSTHGETKLKLTRTSWDGSSSCSGFAIGWPTVATGFRKGLQSSTPTR
jgi:hypothetical protein